VSGADDVEPHPASMDTNASPLITCHWLLHTRHSDPMLALSADSGGIGRPDYPAMIH